MNVTKRSIAIVFIGCWLAIVAIAVATRSLGPIVLGLLAVIIGHYIGIRTRR